MAILLKPVKQVESATELRQISLSIAVLLKSLKNVYESSNFYKEARIVSFIDRLLNCITDKLKQSCSLAKIMTNSDAQQE